MQSMTGFGQGRRESPLGVLTVEIRGVNHRFVDLSLRMPQDFQAFEPWVRAEVQRRFTRGKITISVQFQSVPGLTQRFEINTPLLERLTEECRRLSGGREPSVENLLLIQGVVVAMPDEARAGQLKALFEEAMVEAFENFIGEREKEGEKLRSEVRQISGEMREAVSIIGEYAGEITDKYRQRLLERIEELLGPRMSTLDPGRLEQEVAIFSDKADIREEITRLLSHLSSLDEFVTGKTGDPIGRKIEFLTQEILRETNTVGSKCRDLDITREVLRLKNLCENLREQIANIV